MSPDKNTIKNPWGFGELMAIAALRYCMGRRSYIVGCCVEWVQANWEHFSAETRSTMIRDLDEELQREKRSPGSLGMECDVELWQDLWSFMSSPSKEPPVDQLRILW